MNSAIIDIISSKLSNSAKTRGWLCTKELAVLLEISERTIIRWRQARKDGDKTVGIPSLCLDGVKHRYYFNDVYAYFEARYI